MFLIEPVHIYEIFSKNSSPAKLGTDERLDLILQLLTADWLIEDFLQAQSTMSGDLRA